MTHTTRSFAFQFKPDSSGLVPGIHAFSAGWAQDVDGRDEPGHDELIETSRSAYGRAGAFYLHGLTALTSSLPMAPARTKSL
ncbi:hypothetical protein D4Q52_01195 [Rhodopseudomonas palustris]|uniref:Uncharacterized protein n=1 Tax=Rhodopseudomonas palustris TaxID=1076 RepID=A0A418VR14_RHOPL|nr:hypothetical protein D4Q52_01195 [Rhodopseudomonas palustris]